MTTLQAQPHTGSYYAATANHKTDYPVLTGATTADVCVIGAGFTGISTALHLAERGYKVAVVEANKVGWGASGRNGGQIISGVSGLARVAKANPALSGRDVFDMQWAGHQIIRDRVKQYNIECDLKFGYLDVSIKPRHLRDNEEDLQQLQKYDFPHECRMLTAEETFEMIGTQEYIGGLLNMGNGHLHPLNLCIGEARAAESLGTVIYEQSPVLSIEETAKPKVTTEHGSVTADTVVIAGNAYHKLQKKLQGLLFPVNSFIIGTEPLPPETIAAINPRDLAVCDPNFVLEYFRLTAEKRLLFGGRCNYFGTDSDVIRKNLRPKMLRVYPQLKNVGIDYAWGGTIGVTVNRVPQLGRINPSIFYCQGYSGHGVNVTHMTGQIMAEAVAGTLERFDLFAKIKPIRIPGAHTFSTPMVALGMMYYKMKDRL